MRTKTWTSRRPRYAVRQGTLAALAIISIALIGTTAAQAELTLAYSFESDLQGFVPNGAGLTLTQDTVGATDGDNSMKVDLVQGATFVGALNGMLTPEFGDPPGLDAIVYDLTITEAFPSEPGDFIDAGITVFGSTQPDFPGGQMEGLSAQFMADQVQLGALTVGTHEIRMDLTTAVSQVTFEEGSFNDIFGVEGSGQNDIIPTGFQIYFNKSSTAPWTGYIDNLRIGTLPPPVDADFNDDDLVDGADLSIWQGAYGVDAAGDANADEVSDGGDFLLWQRQYNAAPFVAAVAVPEPATLAFACVLLLASGMRRSSRFQQAAEAMR